MHVISQKHVIFVSVSSFVTGQHIDWLGRVHQTPVWFHPVRLVLSARQC
jgi:hypothetical protein